MFGWLKRGSTSKTSGERREFQDEVLGLVVWNEAEEAWIVPVRDSPIPFQILLGGAGQPDPRLISHARDIFTSPGTLLGLLKPVLDAAAAEFPVAAEEIAGLRIKSVDLMWPDHPDNGMISFDGPGTEDRLWRCDYIGRQPRDLGFDD
jgi:hypothetical protein